MALDDVRQTHKEYKERINRIQQKKNYNDQKNLISNQIKDLKDEVANILSQISKKEEEYNKITSDEIYALSVMYNNKTLLSTIAEQAKCTTCSPNIVEEIEFFSKEGINDSNIDIDKLEKISLAEEKIANEIPHTSLLGDILDNFGKDIKFPGEGNNNDFENNDR